MINIAELLKDAPKGMKLYSPLLGEVEFAEVMDTDYVPIRVMCGIIGERFDKFGRYKGNEYPNAECLLFPSKEVRTWEGWKLPVEPKFKVGDWVVRKDGETFSSGNYAEQITLIENDKNGKCIWLSSKSWVRDNDIRLYRLWTIQDAKDGDVLATTSIRSCPFIYRKTSYNNQLAYYYAGIDGNGDFCEGCLKRTLYHFGSVTNVAPATKEQSDMLFKKMRETGYQWDAEKKELKKIKPNYDIANFKPFDKVLVRYNTNEHWRCDIFSYTEVTLFRCVGGAYCQCIPFNEDTKHLLGTTDMCPEEYINW